MLLQSIHHIAIICSKYEVSKKFYTEVLGCSVVAEHYRSDRNSWKLDLAINGVYCIELFSFPDPPTRTSRPEAAGLRHLAFSVNNLEAQITFLQSKNVSCESVRTDEYTCKRFTFFNDPDGLPIELYEV